MKLCWSCINDVMNTESLVENSQLYAQRSEEIANWPELTKGEKEASHL